MSEYSPLAQRIQRIQNAYNRMSQEEQAALLVAVGLIKNICQFPQAMESEPARMAIQTIKAFPIKASLEELAAVIMDELWTQHGETPPDDLCFTMSGGE
jgi:hypothetical protein